jgi:hypothetical protein
VATHERWRHRRRRGSEGSNSAGSSSAPLRSTGTPPSMWRASNGRHSLTHMPMSTHRSAWPGRRPRERFGHAPSALRAGPGHRPDPLRPAAGRGEHLRVAVAVSAEPAAAEHPLPCRRGPPWSPMVADSLCGSTPMMTRPTPPSSPLTSRVDRRGGQRFFELSTTPLEPNPPRCPANAHATSEPHQPTVGSRSGSARPDTSTTLPGRPWRQ